MSLGCMIAQPTQPVPASHRKPRPSISRSPPPTPGTPDPTARPPSNRKHKCYTPQINPRRPPTTLLPTRPPPPSSTPLPPQPSPSSYAFPHKNPNPNTKPRITTSIKQPSSKNAPPSITPAVSNQERDGGVKGNEYLSQVEPGARSTRERARRKAVRGVEDATCYFSFLRDDFQSFGTIVSFRMETLHKCSSKQPPPPHNQK